MKVIKNFLIIVGGLAFIYMFICGALWIIKTHGIIAFVATFILFIVGDAAYIETNETQSSNNRIIQCRDLQTGD